MLNYNILSNKTCQPLKINQKRNDPIWYYVDPQPDKKYALGQVLGLTKDEASVLNTMAIFCKKYKTVYCKQETIAELSGVALGTANRMIKKLTSLGFIAKKWNGYNKPCWYKMSSFFNSLEVQKALSKKLSVFYFTINMTLSSVSTEIIRCINVFNTYIKKQGEEANIYIQSLRKEENQKEILKEKGSVLEKIPSPEVQEIENKLLKTRQLLEKLKILTPDAIRTHTKLEDDIRMLERLRNEL